MPEINLTQAEADTLFAMQKRCINNEVYLFPDLGGKVEIPLISLDRRCEFKLDISRGSIKITKTKLQNRTLEVIILVRLELNGAPHRNPDDTEIPCPHLHTYVEGYGDKWAFPVPVDKFSNLSDVSRTLDDFMAYCNIVEPPVIERGIFT